MEHKLPDLPWPKDALGPHISAETLDYHHGKHHAAYVTKLNAGLEGTEWAEMSLDDLVRKTSGGLFNNAAQHWNHSFYWNCLSPNGGGPATGALGEAINGKWGSFDKFKEEFTNSAATNFGSGWTWLVKNAGGGSLRRSPTFCSRKCTLLCEKMPPEAACGREPYFFKKIYFVIYKKNRVLVSLQYSYSGLK